MQAVSNRWVVVAVVMLLSACAGTAEGPDVRFSNADRSDERRAHDSCRADAGSGDVGATAAYHACMARYRRPPDDE